MFSAVSGMAAPRLVQGRRVVSAFQPVRLGAADRMDGGVVAIHQRSRCARAHRRLRRNTRRWTERFRQPNDRHRVAVFRLRTCLLGRSLFEPPDSAAVGFPQSAPHGGGVVAAHQFSRASRGQRGVLQHRQHLRRGHRRRAQLSAAWPSVRDRRRERDSRDLHFRHLYICSIRTCGSRPRGRWAA